MQTECHFCDTLISIVSNPYTLLFAHSNYRWSWERGFIVALLAGSSQALHQTNNAHSCDTLILQLLCQLHNSRYVSTLRILKVTLFTVLLSINRYMLRAAHTKSILGKTRRTAANSSKTRAVKEENYVIGGYTARSAGTKRSASSASSSSRGGARKYSRNSHGGRNSVSSAQSAKETAEVKIIFHAFIVQIIRCYENFLY